MSKQGFTLIELLVVVLIIGILSAVALPQYEKSVSRARAAEAMTTTKTVLDAAAIYVATYRRCPSDLSDLDIKVSPNGKDWTFAIDNDDLGSRNCGVTVTPRKGTSFTARRIYVKNPGETFTGVDAGSTVWECASGTCTDFFFDLGVKAIGESDTYYQ